MASDPHPLLAQVPLTVSPFLSLPTATPLPYSYKQLPSTLPPSILSAPPNASNPSAADPAAGAAAAAPPEPPAYIVSQTGVTATPDSILSSCVALQSHLAQLESNARATLKDWEDRRRAADLAEKRRVAPGWLDGDVKILKPENVSEGQDVQMGEASGVQQQQQQQQQQQPQRRTSVGIKGLIERRDGIPDEREGEALDRAFGGLDLK